MPHGEAEPERLFGGWRSAPGRGAAHVRAGALQSLSADLFGHRELPRQRPRPRPRAPAVVLLPAADLRRLPRAVRELVHVVAAARGAGAAGRRGGGARPCEARRISLSGRALVGLFASALPGDEPVVVLRSDHAGHLHADRDPALVRARVGATLERAHAVDGLGPALLRDRRASESLSPLRRPPARRPRRAPG